jgi:hypothetical protein
MGFGTFFVGQNPDVFDDQEGTGRLIVATVPSPPIAVTVVKHEEEIAQATAGGQKETNLSYPARLRRTFGGFTGETTSDEFFEKIYVLPRSINAGLLLSTQVFTIDLYSSFRGADRSWTAYSDTSAGLGVTLDDNPPPTVVFAPNSGATRTLTVTLTGPPSIDGTLDFTFDGGIGTLQIPITANRSVLFPFEPESPMVEVLQFLTDILQTRSGKEQRRALRKNPRVTLEYEVITDGNERRLLENLLFDGQPRAFGVPLWYQATGLASDVDVDDTSVLVNSTAYADYRNGGLAVVWDGADNFEALQIASFTSDTINFDSPFTKSFDRRSARVMPVVSAVLGERVDQSRWRNQLQRNRVKFQITDNDNDISSTAAFNTYQPTGGTERVLLDGPNFVPGDTINESWNTTFSRIDNQTGAITQFSDQPVSRKGSSKGFVSGSRQDIWEIRQLLWALKGQATSFYLPTFFPDFEPIVDLTTSDQSIDITDVSYVDSIQSRQPRNILRVHLTDGTTSDPKLITGASKPSTGVERLSLAPDTVGINATTAEISRIELIEKVRLNTDRIRITHFDANGSATVTFPVIAVLESDD